MIWHTCLMQLSVFCQTVEYKKFARVVKWLNRHCWITLPGMSYLNFPDKLAKSSYIIRYDQCAIIRDVTDEATNVTLNPSGLKRNIESLRQRGCGRSFLSHEDWMFKIIWINKAYWCNRLKFRVLYFVDILIHIHVVTLCYFDNLICF